MFHVRNGCVDFSLTEGEENQIGDDDDEEGEIEREIGSHVGAAHLRQAQLLLASRLRVQGLR